MLVLVKFCKEIFQKVMRDLKTEKSFEVMKIHLNETTL